MNENEIINEYFNNYFLNKKKKIYNEDLITTFAVGAFLYFLFYILMRTFSVNKYEQESITTKLEDSPKRVEEIIKFLDEIKKIIKNDITNKKLDKVFSLIDSLDGSLLSLKRTRDHEKNAQTVSYIINNIKSLLEEILDLYSEQDKNKKENIFNKIKNILNQFGLSQKFELILKQILEKNSNVIKNDEKKPVTVDPEIVINTVVTPPSFKPKSDDKKGNKIETVITPIKPEESMPDEDITIRRVEVISAKDLTDEDTEPEEDAVSEDEEEDEEAEQRLKEEEEEKKKLEDLRKKNDLIIRKKTYIDKIPTSIKIHITLALHMLNIVPIEEVVELYDVLNSGKTGNDLIDAIIETEIFDKAKKKIEETNILYDFTNLKQFFEDKKIKTDDLIVDIATEGGNFNDDKYTLNVKIYKSKFSEGIIMPLNETDSSDSTFKDFYVLSFIKEPNKNKNIFSIKMTDLQKLEYQLFKDKFSFHESSKYPQHEITICNGIWDVDIETKTLKFKNISFEGDFGKIVEINKSYEIIIFKKGTTSYTEIKNIPTLKKDNVNKFYFVIRINEDYYLKEITKNFFPEVTSYLKMSGKIPYVTKEGAVKYVVDNEIKKLVTTFIVPNRNKDFLEFSPSGETSDEEDFLEYDNNFFKINNDAIDETKDSNNNKKIVIHTNVTNWKYG